MKNKKLIWTLVIAAVAVLLYFQIHSLGAIGHKIEQLNGGKPWSWKRDFFGVIAQCSPAYLAFGLIFIYSGYVLRALRWKIFLSKLKRVPLGTMVAPQFIGFTGLVLLGRPGEFIRPFLLARKTGVKFSSQMAVLVLERIFDMGAFAVIVALNIAFAPSLQSVAHYALFRRGSYILLVAVAAIAAVVFALYKQGPRIVAWSRRSLNDKLADKLDSFSHGLHILSGADEVLSASVVSLGVWLAIAACYLTTVHAFAAPELKVLNLPQVLLLMFFSVAGGVIQLPGVGGGSQVVTIAALNLVFNVPIGTAAAGGILIWLMTSVSVVIPGLLFARTEHVSLTAVSHASEEEAEHTSLSQA
jgi:uncharacterized protein (TIRG00374 family)